jgi:hypothetical protein
VDENDDNQLPSSATDKLFQKRLKLEFKILLNKYYSPQNAGQFLARMTYMVIQENDDDILDKQLTFLRNIGKGGMA